MRRWGRARWRPRRDRSRPGRRRRAPAGNPCAPCPGSPPPPSCAAAGRRCRPLVAVRRVPPDGDPGQVAAVAQGRAAVQDEASQLAALALARADAAGPAGERSVRVRAGSTCARGRAARRGCSPGLPRRGGARAAGRRRAPAPGPAVRAARRAALGRGGRRRDRSRVAARFLRPGARGRPLLGARRAAPPGRGPLAPLARGRRRAGPAAARACSPRRSTRPRPAASWLTSPAPRTWRRPATS